MTPRRRRAAAALVLGSLAGSFAVAVLAVSAAPASAEPGAWTSSWDDEHEDGVTGTGSAVVLAGTFTYDTGGLPGTGITDVDITLQPDAAGNCAAPQHQHVSVPQGLEQVAGPTTSAPSTTASTVLPTTTTNPANLSSYHFAFTITPPCNGTYDVDVVATRGGADQLEGSCADTPSAFGSRCSPPLHLEDLLFDLHPASVPTVTATLNPDRTGTIAWTAPAGYAAGAAPADFRGYRVQRADGSGAWFNLSTVGPAELSYRDPLTNAQPNIYRYRVFAVRNGAQPGQFNTSPIGEAVIAQISIGGPPSPPTTRRPGPPATSPPRGGGVPISAGPTTTIDEGFDSTLPFDPEADLVFGPEDAVLPDDASGLLDIDSGDDPGNGVAVPVAVGSVIVVWALHLRLLTRRATEPI